MSAEVVRVEWEGNLITQMAALKRVPVAKVVRNAARDFARAAFDATPLAKKPPKPGPGAVYALYDAPVRKGPSPGQRRALARAKKRLRKVTAEKSHYGAKARRLAAERVARIEAQISAPVSENAKLVKYIPYAKNLSRYTRKVTWGRGWSLASWLGVLHDLGIQGESRGHKAARWAAKNPAMVRRIGDAVEASSEVMPSWYITDDIEFTARQGEGARIIQAGLANAARILKANVEKELKARWRS